MSDPRSDEALEFDDVDTLTPGQLRDMRRMFGGAEVEAERDDLRRRLAVAEARIEAVSTLIGSHLVRVTERTEGPIITRCWEIPIAALETTLFADVPTDTKETPNEASQDH